MCIRDSKHTNLLGYEAKRAFNEIWLSLKSQKVYSKQNMISNFGSQTLSYIPYIASRMPTLNIHNSDIIDTAGKL